MPNVRKQPKTFAGIKSWYPTESPLLYNKYLSHPERLPAIAARVSCDTQYRSLTSCKFPDIPGLLLTLRVANPLV